LGACQDQASTGASLERQDSAHPFFADNETTDTQAVSVTTRTPVKSQRQGRVPAKISKQNLALNRELNNHVSMEKRGF